MKWKYGNVSIAVLRMLSSRNLTRGAIKMIKVEQRVIDLHVMMIAIFYQNANCLMNLLKCIIEKWEQRILLSQRKKEKKVSHAIFISFSDDKLMNQNIQHFEHILHKFSPSVSQSANIIEN